MTDIAQQTIKIGTLVMGNQADPAGYIRQILAHGFESFSLMFWKTTEGTDWAKLADQVRDALGDSGAIISSLGMFSNPLESQPDDIAGLRGWEACIDAAHLFGCDIVAGFAGRLRDQPIDASIPRFQQVFGELARRAEDKGVRIAFENCDMGGTWRSGDWNIAHNPKAWTMMFDAVPSANLGLEWEPCHQMVNLIDPLPQLRAWISKVFHVHGKCATIKWDVIRQHGIGGAEQFAFHRTPGFGDCDWTDIISELRAAGYVGSIDIEGWHDPVYRGELEMTGQVAGLNYLKRCRGGDYVPNPR
ncbi:MAG: sugar phosphate isomerase/epimerase family protein [Anaerolineae bacterium]